MPSSTGDIRAFFPAHVAHVKKRPSPGSADGDDPLATGDARLRLPDLRPGRSPDARALSGQPRIAVVLVASPGRRPASASASAPVAPDLSRLKRRYMVNKETPVPLPNISNIRTWATPRPAATASAPPSVNSRGRPKGWKAGMSYSAMRGNPSAGARARQARAKAPSSGLVKRRGRPPRPPSPPPRDIYHGLQPQFVDFLCEWAGCKAELHNLDTLRRHVYAVHGRCEACRWGKCARAQPARELPDADEFRAHMDEAHLVPYAWHVGDGPRNSGRATPAGDELPGFLNDAEGNQVTPSIRGQEVEDAATWRMNRRQLRELLIRRNENLPDDEWEPESDEG